MHIFELEDVIAHDIHYPRIYIPQHQTTFFCGKSGCGKSTLLKLLNATTPYTQGSILYKGKPLEHYDTLVLRKEVILAAQHVFLFDESIQDNFKTFYSYREQETRSTSEIQKFLSICCMQLPLSSNCQQLSGGERQRVFIAIALSFHPSVLMLDEPTSALDDKTAQQFMQQLTSYCHEQGITLLIITHDKQLATTYANHRYELDEEVVYA